MLAYVTICAGCLFEQYFLKQARANSTRDAHARANPGHDVRVTRIRTTRSSLSSFTTNDTIALCPRGSGQDPGT